MVKVKDLQALRKLEAHCYTSIDGACLQTVWRSRQDDIEDCRKYEMRKTGQRVNCQAVNRDKLIEGLSFKILRDDSQRFIFGESLSRINEFCRTDLRFLETEPSPHFVWSRGISRGQTLHHRRIRLCSRSLRAILSFSLVLCTQKGQKVTPSFSRPPISQRSLDQRFSCSPND
jgi:hypothetical protein